MIPDEASRHIHQKEFISILDRPVVINSPLQTKKDKKKIIDRCYNIIAKCCVIITIQSRANPGAFLSDDEYNNCCSNHIACGQKARLMSYPMEQTRRVLNTTVFRKIALGKPNNSTHAFFYFLLVSLRIFTKLNPSLNQVCNKPDLSCLNYIQTPGSHTT